MHGHDVVWRMAADRDAGRIVKGPRRQVEMRAWFHRGGRDKAPRPFCPNCSFQFSAFSKLTIFHAALALIPQKQPEEMLPAWCL